MNLSNPRDEDFARDDEAWLDRDAHAHLRSVDEGSEEAFDNPQAGDIVRFADLMRSRSLSGSWRSRQGCEGSVSGSVKIDCLMLAFLSPALAMLRCCMWRCCPGVEMEGQDASVFAHKRSKLRQLPEMAGLHMQTPANIFMTARRHVTMRDDLLHQIGALFASPTIDLFLVVISSCQDTTPQVYFVAPERQLQACYHQERKHIDVVLSGWKPVSIAVEMPLSELHNAGTWASAGRHSLFERDCQVHLLGVDMLETHLLESNNSLDLSIALHADGK
ncbi:hypothetical protein M409DRAFT_52480 [Zasmidium cellare ATCC 36951]|uniref:Uncharacterized protein n=1 Tax=Zasmidium cellare ATCC 36951 TaxID=1080233 RepID=A0A6A6CQ26_ZASCE|nr:uncharacterized protein M409DRAFT_52480 [Zasmidium cellare ATCC 36951]KAF2169205.1 hypothetical protein M409DRAFT_52480 [Zasmidium cellare ATCC 36951]